MSVEDDDLRKSNAQAAPGDNRGGIPGWSQTPRMGRACKLRPPQERSPDMPVRLSRRERDCLIWTAQGKSSWDIGTILNISGNTVNYHLKNAMRKLGTTSRTVAVVKAIRLNLIELP